MRPTWPQARGPLRGELDSGGYDGVDGVRDGIRPARGGIQVPGLPPPALLLILRLLLFETINVSAMCVASHPLLSFVLREGCSSQVSLVRRQRIPRHFQRDMKLDVYIRKELDAGLRCQAARPCFNVFSSA